ncbi:choice-of-anchor P family protein [Hydrogenibacillus sp. N12]|uniref:choice-of-anchor P family protein n=1 Tax=Hydrogenibacillus sp. N12 TaxID=2866627 RepID=UPI001C7D4EDB|nr:choice-of-anchor P family protein [Hydrogenibacillus sp. N12]QZA33559.1 S-layer homology domain-containing protein [Hydrogenibacillus sp. N12]
MRRIFPAILSLLIASIAFFAQPEPPRIEAAPPKAPPFSGHARTQSLEISALSGLGILKVVAGLSEARLDNQSQPPAQASGVPVELTLLNGKLPLLASQSSAPPDTSDDQERSSASESGVTVGLFTARSSAQWEKRDPAAAASTSTANLGIAGLINLGAIENSTTVKTSTDGSLSSTARVHLADLSLLAGAIKIEAVDITATAIANGKPGGAQAKVDHAVARLRVLGIPYTIRGGQVLNIPGVAKIALSDGQTTTAPDGTSASATGSGLTIQLLGILFNGVTVQIGLAEVSATVPKGGIPFTPPSAEPPYALEKKALTASPLPDETFDYAITYRILADVEDVILRDPLPKDVQFVAASGGGRYDVTEHAVIWSLGSLKKGASGTLTTTVRVNPKAEPGTILENVATLSAANQKSVTTPPVRLRIASPAPYQISKMAAHATVEVGGIAEFRIAYRMLEEASAVEIIDSLPPNTTLVSASGGGQYDPLQNAVIWKLGDQLQGAGDVFVVRLKVDPRTPSGTTLRNAAIISAKNRKPLRSSEAVVTVGTKVYLPFVTGYPDQTFRPYRLVTRAELASMVAHIMKLEAYTGHPVSYRDVPVYHWARKAVAAVTAKSLFPVLADNVFEPDRPATRAEIAYVMVRMYDLDLIEFANRTTTTAPTFTDVPKTHWAYNAIETAVRLGFLSGDPDGRFRSNDAVTRAETVVLLSRALGRGPLVDGNVPVRSHYRDVNRSDWYFGWIEGASRVAYRAVHVEGKGDVLEAYLDDQPIW